MKGFIRVIDHSQGAQPTVCTPQCIAAIQFWTRLFEQVHSEQVPFPIDIKELIRPKAVTVRLYVIKAEGLAALDGGNSSDPYLYARLGDTEFSCRDEVVKGTLKPYFGRCFQFETLLPGPTQLQLAVYDWDLVGKDDLIGTTTIDLEDRYFSPEWRALSQPVSGGVSGNGPSQRCWPIETRTLRDNGSFKSRGKVQCWVDVFPKAEARSHTPIDIAMAPPEDFELRVILYKTRKVPIMDQSSGTNDAYVTATLTTVDTNGRLVLEIITSYALVVQSHVMCRSLRHMHRLFMQSDGLRAGDGHSLACRERTGRIQLAFSISAHASARGADALNAQTLGQRCSWAVRFDRLLHA